MGRLKRLKDEPMIFTSMNHVLVGLKGPPIAVEQFPLKNGGWRLSPRCGGSVAQLRERLRSSTSYIGLDASFILTFRVSSDNPRAFGAAPLL